MKAFLKGVLLVLAALLALKLLPLMFALGCGLAVSLVGVFALGLSALAVLFGVFVTLAAVLAPIWLPVLAAIGVVALIRRANRSSLAN